MTATILAHGLLAISARAQQGIGSPPKHVGAPKASTSALPGTSSETRDSERLWLDPIERFERRGDEPRPAPNSAEGTPGANRITIESSSQLLNYDSLYTKDNFNYTRPWGADFTPYLMMGVNASYPFNNNLTGAVLVVNGYWHLADANAVPSSGGQLAYKVSPLVTV